MEKMSKKEASCVFRKIAKRMMGEEPTTQNEMARDDVAIAKKMGYKPLKAVKPKTKDVEVAVDGIGRMSKAHAEKFYPDYKHTVIEETDMADPTQNISIEEGLLSKQQLDLVAKKYNNDKDLKQVVKNYHNALASGEYEEVKLHGSLVKDILHDKGMNETADKTVEASVIKEAKTFKQFSHQLAESKMSELHADIRSHLDRHIETFKSYGGTEALMDHMSTAAKKIVRLHKITNDRARAFVRDYVEASLQNNNKDL